MRVGQTYKFRYDGGHGYVTLCILHDYKRNTRYLYNIDIGCQQGLSALLYAKPDRILTKNELRNLYEKIDENKITRRIGQTI